MGLVKKDGTWYYQYWEGRKRQRKSLATGDKREADIRAEKFRKARRARRNGFESYDETEARPFVELVEDYAKELKRRGRCDAHAEKVKRRILVLCSGVRSVLELTTDRVRARLADIAETGTERKGFKGNMPAKPFSAKTSNDYRAALHGLFAHLVKNELWHENPVAKVPRVDRHEKTRERAALTLEQLEHLFAFVGSLDSRGVERAVLYRLAANTGLRRSECKALRWSSIDFEAAELVLAGKYTKNRKEARLPLNASTLAALRSLLAARKEKNKGEDVPASSPVFSRIPLVRTLYSDLKKAKLQTTDRFEGIDLHSLRVTFITNLQLAGVSLAQAQKLARHSTPTLTANVYTKPSAVDAHAAVAKIDGAKKCDLGGGPGAKKCDLGGGPPDSSTHQPALTEENSQRDEKNAPSLEPRKDAALKALHPAGFEPARWGSKPPSQAAPGNSLHGPSGVPGGGRSPEALADELLERVDQVSDAEAAALARAAKILRAQARRASDEGDGKVIRLG